FRQYRQDNAARLKDQRAARARGGRGEGATGREGTEPLVRRSLSLPLSLDLLLRLASEHEGRTQVALIRDAVARYIAALPPPGRPSRLPPAVAAAPPLGRRAQGQSSSG